MFGMNENGKIPLVYSCSGASSAAQILKRHHLAAAKHYDLSKMRVKKKYHVDFDPEEAEQMLRQILADLQGQPEEDASAMMARDEQSFPTTQFFQATDI